MLHKVYVLPCKALRKEGQASKDFLTLVKLFHIRSCYHSHAMVVHNAKVVHTQAITHWNTNQKKIVILWAQYRLEKKSQYI